MGVGGEGGAQSSAQGRKKAFLVMGMGWAGGTPSLLCSLSFSLSELTVFPPPHCPSLLRLGGTAGRHLRKWLTCRFHQDLVAGPFFFFQAAARAPTFLSCFLLFAHRGF